MIFKFLYFLEGFDKVMKRLKEKKNGWRKRERWVYVDFYSEKSQQKTIM